MNELRYILEEEMHAVGFSMNDAEEIACNLLECYLVLTGNEDDAVDMVLENVLDI